MKAKGSVQTHQSLSKRRSDIHSGEWLWIPWRQLWHLFLYSDSFKGVSLKNFLLNHNLHKINCIHIKPTIWEYWQMHNILSKPPPQLRYRKFTSCLCSLFLPSTPFLWTPLYFLELYINKIIQYVLFCVFHSAWWMILEFIQVVACICSLLLFIAE